MINLCEELVNDKKKLNEKSKNNWKKLKNNKKRNFKSNVLFSLR